MKRFHVALLRIAAVAGNIVIAELRAWR